MLKDEIARRALQKEIESMERDLIKKWKKLHPETEILIISLPKNNRMERAAILEHIKKIYTGDTYEAYCSQQE